VFGTIAWYGMWSSFALAVVFAGIAVIVFAKAGKRA
jgi:hypothetical protein